MDVAPASNPFNMTSNDLLAASVITVQLALRVILIEQMVLYTSLSTGNVYNTYPPANQSINKRKGGIS